MEAGRGGIKEDVVLEQQAVLIVLSGEESTCPLGPFFSVAFAAERGERPAMLQAA